MELAVTVLLVGAAISVLFVIMVIMDCLAKVLVQQRVLRMEVVHGDSTAPASVCRVVKITLVLSVNIVLVIATELDALKIAQVLA